MKRKFLIAGLLLAIGGFPIFGVNRALAQNSGGPYTPLIQKLAQKFDLKETDVQAVFDELKSDQQAQMRVKFEEKLTQLVKEDKLTEAQKQALIAKHKEFQDKHKETWEQLKNLTPEARRQLLQKERNELEAWIKAQGIDIDLLPGFQMHKKTFGFGHMHPMRMW